MQTKARVLIVDDSAFVRLAVERMLAGTAGLEVVGTAANGREAVQLAHELRPDVIVMDIDMPEMDGLEALQVIMRECPTAVLMLSTMTRSGAEETMQALDYGAVDFIDKSSAGTTMDIYSLSPVLRERILALAGTEAPSRAVRREPEEIDSISPAQPCASGEYEVVAIGASTGGPRALSEILGALPAGFGAAVLVAQHMPAGFTETLAERLNRRCALEVTEAQDGAILSPGHVLIAPGGKQISVRRDGARLSVRVQSGPRTLLHRPSVDTMLTSVAAAVGRRAIGVILTGMGSDGALGLRRLREAGGRTIVESPQTAVIYGMPRSARPAAERVLGLPQIAPYLRDLCSGTSGAEGGS